MERIERALVTVEASIVPEAQRSRAQDLATLFAWCGGGELTPNQVHAFLRPDAGVSRPQAAGLLLRDADGAHYLATAAHVLSERAGSGPRPVFALDLPDATLTGPAPADADEPAFSLTELTLAPSHDRSRDGKPWFPAMSFPHLDLALVRLDADGSGSHARLEADGYRFQPFERVGDGPSRDGAAVDLLLPDPAAKPDGATTVPARASGLNEHLSFFWLDRHDRAEPAASPVVEDGRIVGFLAPGVDAADLAPDGGSVRSSAAAAVKARFLRLLLAAFERRHAVAEARSV